MNSSRIELKWVIPEHSTVPPGFQAGVNAPELVLQTLIKRGYGNVEEAQRFLDYTRYIPAPAFDLPDMEKGVGRILSAIKKHEVIGIWGDFDVDGQTSTAILVSTLRHLDANVKYHIPVRSKESHGIKLDPLKAFIANGVNIILTCDTGVSETASIAYAQSSGIDVVVTDHHMLPLELPPAYALVNPRRLPATHPLSTLAGAGVAYKFAEALLEGSGQQEFATSLHDLAALGCVADLAVLTGDTRYLVQSGINRINTSPRESETAMLKSAGVKAGRITEEIISFILAPRLNAVGRLDDANPMVEFLLSSDPLVLNPEINRLEGLNEQRKILCDQVLRGALSQVDRNPGLLDQPALILNHPDWPAGIVGIVASRLVELYHRPVFMLVSPPGQPLRGSARSIEGLDISAVLTQNKDLLLSFGGHPMAAGLSIPEDSLNIFQRAVNHTIQEFSSDLKIEQELVIDHFIPPEQLSLETVMEIEKLAPFGPGNPALVFASGNMQLISTTRVGKLKEHLQMTVEDRGGDRTKLIWWHGAGLPLPEGQFDLAYNARSSDYRGQAQVQFEWLAHRQIMSESITVAQKPKKQNIDLRHPTDALPALEQVLQDLNVEVWKEGSGQPDIRGKNRQALVPADKFVIWTVPPDLETLKTIVNKTEPSSIYWVLSIPSEQNPAQFLRTLGKVVKTGLQKGHTTFDFEYLASCTAMNERVVALGLKWHEYYGNFQVTQWSPSQVTISLGGNTDRDSLRMTEKNLTHAMGEVKAFSNHLLRLNLDEFLKELG